jgi:hypothetical protein
MKESRILGCVFTYKLLTGVSDAAPKVINAFIGHPNQGGFLYRVAQDLLIVLNLPIN